ncbi:hypothetical protein GGU11DRAFT_388648 [Lentinula aff. detonsa]|nr:hypothetical protein GGU11DRAFT_388648 [Lentinula aff. detonsa]
MLRSARITDIQRLSCSGSEHYLLESYRELPFQVLNVRCFGLPRIHVLYKYSKHLYTNQTTDVLSPNQMSTETTIKRKKGSSDKSKPQPALDGDHRKRSRNRCIRSCINCHASKRMCDRKRPACARCTQLGLTGLCVYEVDDPNQRSNTQDESSRLLERVAELEGVIRELKNKPHPRWISSACSEHSDDAPNLAHSSGRPTKGSYIQGASPSHAHREESCLPLTPAFSTSSPSSPSSAVTPPNDSPASPHAVIHDDPARLMDLDLDIFAQSPTFAGYSEDSIDIHQQFPGLGILKSYSAAQPCSCILEASNYHTMLELSLRLRKAATILARSPHHQPGAHCLLNQRLSELDALTTDTLSSVDSPHLSYSAVHPSTMLSSNLPSTIYASGNSASRLDNWLSGAITDTKNAGTDSFMSWDPPRRSQ